MMSAEGAGMAETAGGLRKISIQFTPEQMVWLQARSERRGGASIASLIREIVADTAAAESDAERVENGEAA